MFRKIAIFSLIIPWLLFSGCASRPADERPTIFVSILPLRGIVSEIVGDDFRVEVLVPPGMNPESFEPTPRQMIDLNRSQLIFNMPEMFLLSLHQELRLQFPFAEYLH